MDYYKMRSVVLHKLRNHLQEREELIEKKLEPPKFKDFQRQLMLEHGVTETMLKKMVENLIPGSTLRDGEIIRKEAF